MGVVDRTVRRSLDRLERAGFIRRERCGQRRVIHLIPDNRADESIRLKVV
jgi:DNA-binding MarR family transcriptional regulator